VIRRLRHKVAGKKTELIAYFDCFSGISGDMALGALLDLGLSRKILCAELDKLGLDGFSIRVRREKRHSIAGLRVRVDVAEAPHDHRHYGDIVDLIDASGIDPAAKRTSKAIFSRLARAEAKVHRCRVKDVAFHEVGAVDSIVDIVGVAVALGLLGVGEVFASPLPLGRGFVEVRHGRIPVPAPATLELLKGVPVSGGARNSELVTPTGAAILASTAKGFGEMPRMRIDRIGYGVGSRRSDEAPNMLRVVLGHPLARFEQDRVLLLESHLDDMNPEIFDHLMDRLFEEGALDVTLSPIQMKKNRPGTALVVVASPQDRERMLGVIFQETTTLGVRCSEVGRYKLHRKWETVETTYGAVRVKISEELNGTVLNIMPEYEDCRRLAKEKGVPLKQIYQAALSLAGTASGSLAPVGAKK